ncbi:superoxide dismutase [Cu-Zn] 5 isoform X2 [Lucilia sericata]|uniref:superoxide dismutase [Cu-Zn] 5 isoform X2 n=1 Tax=Lucilia sericata TaxID=13632 RepID=UPI0018A80ACB|nr:superoxide dismutase [Cu-Zn] 5 isoform X2 [Lucilia sericata]
MSFLTVHSLQILKYFCVIIIIVCNLINDHTIAAQSILDRFRPSSNLSSVGVDEQVKIVSGTKVKRFERFTVPLGGTVNLLQPQPSLYYVAPQWQAGAKITGEGIDGMITFQQLPYNNDIKVTLNATGIPAGKHALHIHTYGDLTDGCKSTGGQFPNNFLGNIDVKEGGEINVAFISVYLTLFGYNGIIGRSIVIHEKPIDLNTALNADIFSSSLHALPNNQAFQNEENSVGEPIACGVISIMGVPVTEK